jgi:hypothetical protein
MLDRPFKPSELRPNTAYTYGRTVYVTDDRGEPTFARGVVDHTINAPRSRSRESEKPVASGV